MNIERVYGLTGYGRLDVDVDALPVARFAFLILFPFLSPFLSFGLASFLCGFVPITKNLVDNSTSQIHFLSLFQFPSSSPNFNAIRVR